MRYGAGAARTAAIGMLVALFVGVLPAWASPQRVDIRPNGFRPIRLQVPMSTKVTWMNGDDRTHRIRSFGRGFINTARLSPGELSAAVLFRWAGSFRYRSILHPALRGAIRVPVKIYPGPHLIPTPGARLRIRVSPAARKSVRFDIQRRLNDGPWIIFRRRVSGPVATFRPRRTGTYAFRARVHLMRTDALSGWSPLRAKKVIPPP